jgi:hypothetical protein
MNEKLKSFLETTRKVVNKLFLYVVIAGSIIAAYLFGAEHTKLTQKPVKHKVEVLKIKKSDVNLAIDEDNHLIIINNKTGNYTMYQDSIGKTIFKLYAKNVWGQNSTLMVK